jgi:hypothetical protein
MLLALLLAAAEPLLVFHGNVALLEDVYRSVLDLPPGTKATPANARSVAIRLRRFLHKAGYALATVRARPEGEHIAVEIDEGRLDKVIFVGGGAFETLRLRLDLHINNDVFNKPELERQLRGLAQRLGLADFAYEVVPLENTTASRLSLEDFEGLEGLSLGLVRPGRAYELHILVQPGVFRPGISPELEVNSLEGGGIGAVYQSGRLLFEEDRLRLGGRIAGALRTRLDNSGSSFVFTRALGEAAFQAPPLLSVVRPAIRGRIDLSSRQRPDLNLESFQFATLEAGVEVALVPLAELRGTIGGGVERRLLYSLQGVAGAPPAAPVSETAQNRPYVEAGLELRFDPRSIRRDQHHRLALRARMYGKPGAGGTERAQHFSGRYQKIFGFGWNELWIEARGFWRHGAILFPEEASIGGGDELRGPFGNEYARRLAVLDLELRWSVIRDLFKVGLFHNAAGYGMIDRATDAEKPRLADSFGIGVHALFIDEFQLDAWFGFGFASGRRSDKGAALRIVQAY